MRHSRLLLAAFVLLLSGCRSAAPPTAKVMPPTAVSSAPQVTELVIEHHAEPMGPADAADTPWDDTFVLSGPITADIALREAQPGPLWLVDSVLFASRKDDAPGQVVAGFTAYYAGGGLDVRLRRDDTTLWIEQRLNDEGAGDVPEEGAIVGGCGPWSVIGEYPLEKDVPIRLKTDATLTTGLAFECKW